MVGDLDLADGGGVEAEAGAEDSVEAFADGCGPIHGLEVGYHTLLMDQDTGIDYHTCLTAGVTGTRGASIDTPIRLIHTGILQPHTWDTGKGAN